MQDIQKQQLQRLNLFFIYALAFSLPLSTFISLKVLALWMFTGVLLIDFTRVWRSEHKVFVVLSVLFILLYFIGIFYSKAKPEAWRILSLKFYFAVFPFIFLSMRRDYARHFSKILLFYVLGSIVAVVILYAHAFYMSISISSHGISFDPRLDKSLSLLESLSTENYFFYRHFAYYKHPSYMAMELIFALVVLLYFRRNEDLGRQNRVIALLTKDYVFLAILFVYSAVIFELSSRTNLVVLFAYYLYAILTSNMRHKLILAVLTLVIGGFFTVINPRSDLFLHNVMNEEELPKKERVATFNRLYFWESAYKIGREHPLFGVGTGDLQWMLYKEYARLGLSRYIDAQYNSHNEFLEIFGKLGLVGLSTFVALLGYSFIESVRKRKMLLFLFLGIVGVNFVFEVILNRIDGIIFTAFFLNFLTLVSPDSIQTDRS